MTETNNFANLTKEEAVVHHDLAKRLIELGVIKVTKGETLEQFFNRAKGHAEILINFYLNAKLA